MVFCGISTTPLQFCRIWSIFYAVGKKVSSRKCMEWEQKEIRSSDPQLSIMFQYISLFLFSHAIKISKSYFFISFCNGSVNMQDQIHVHKNLMIIVRFLCAGSWLNFQFWNEKKKLYCLQLLHTISSSCKLIGTCIFLFNNWTKIIFPWWTFPIEYTHIQWNPDFSNLQGK